MSGRDSLSPELQVAFDVLMAAAANLRKQAAAMTEALEIARKAGVEIRQSDIDVVTTRFMTQIPDALERRAGSLLPPVTGKLTIDVSKVRMKGRSK